MPTLTRTNARERDTAGIRHRRVETYTGPVAYPNVGATVGDPLVGADVSLGTIEFVTPFLISSGSAVRLCYYDHTTATIRIFIPNTGVEVANGVDLSTFSGRFEVIGK